MSAAPDPPRLGVMLSGSGRTLLNLRAAIDDGRQPARLALVIATRECQGAQRARAMGVDTLVIPGEIPAPRLADTLAEFGVDWLALAGYLRLVHLPREFQSRAANIHPALLPAFGGPGMHGIHVHRAVLDAGCRVSGATVHLCDARYDTGPIVAQRLCPVLDDDTPETLAARVFELETALYPEALRFLFSGRWEAVGRRVRALPGVQRP